MKYNRKENRFPSNQNLNIYRMFTEKMDRAAKAYKEKEIESLEERYKGISLYRKILNLFFQENQEFLHLLNMTMVQVLADVG